MSRIIKPGEPGFFINRRRYVESEASVGFGVEGLYIARAIKPGHGVVRERVFPNLITDLGLNALGTGGNFLRMHLGTGTATPAFSDTSLGAFGVNVADVAGAAVYSAAASAPWYAQLALTWTSAVGGATGNWTEIGISNQNTNGNLRSRALILDNMGAPTTFPVLADEQFQGSYIFRTYAPASDNAQAITLSGAAYTATIRALGVTTVNANGGQWGPKLGSAAEFQASSNSAQCFTGALAAVTAGTPGGSALGGGDATATTAAYGSGNYYRDCSYRWGSGQAVGTVRTAVVPVQSGRFQVEYNPTFSKLTTQEFIHNQRVSWARR